MLIASNINNTNFEKNHKNNDIFRKINFIKVNISYVNFYL